MINLYQAYKKFKEDAQGSHEKNNKIVDIDLQICHCEWMHLHFERKSSGKWKAKRNNIVCPVMHHFKLG